MSHWTQGSYRAGLWIDYRRFVVLEVAVACGVDEDMAFYYTCLDGWEMKSKSSAPRALPPGASLDQFLSLVACTEWECLSIEQAKEVARVAGITDDGELKRLKCKDPRSRRKRGRGLPEFYLQGRMLDASSG